jgi:glycosyltransferase involved in cell wall biosynthesis
MKVAIIINYWKNSPGGGGGIKTYIENLLKELKKREDIDAKLIFRVGGDPENYRIGGNKFLFALRTFLTLRRLKPEVIHSQEVWFCLLAAYLYKIFYNAKVIHTYHTQPGGKLNVFKRIYKILIIISDRFDSVSFVSRALKNNIEKFYEFKFKDSTITYAGISSKKVSESPKREFYKKFNLKENSIILLALGLTGIKYKAEGAKLLIKAIKKLRDEYPNIKLILTKEGLYSKELKEFAKKEGVQNSVIFTGTIDNPEVALAICDIYTHISLGEGLPMALLEAMSMGKPIIATKAGGIPEAIEDEKNGILVEPDVDRIVEKIEYLLDNRKFAVKLGWNARKTIEEKFSWKGSANRFLDIYKKILIKNNTKDCEKP